MWHPLPLRMSNFLLLALVACCCCILQAQPSVAQRQPVAWQFEQQAVLTTNAPQHAEWVQQQQHQLIQQQQQLMQQAYQRYQQQYGAVRQPHTDAITQAHEQSAAQALAEPLPDVTEDPTQTDALPHQSFERAHESFVTAQAGDLGDMLDRIVHNKTSPISSNSTSNATEADWRRACANRCEERTLDVTGVGLRTVPSDRAEIRATIEARRMVNTTLTQGNLEPDELSALISAVQADVSKRARAVIALLTGEGVAAPHVTKLRTSGIGLEPLYEYKDGRQFLMGYRASNSITFRVNVTRAGATIDAIVEAGVSRIDGIAFFASPERVNTARMSAITAAVEDAVAQATSALLGLHSIASTRNESDPRPLQIVRFDITGVTRPEPPGGEVHASDVSAVGGPQMARSYALKAEAVSMDSSPVEGEDKVVGAQVSMKIRF